MLDDNSPTTKDFIIRVYECDIEQEAPIDEELVQEYTMAGLYDEFGYFSLSARRLLPNDMLAPTPDDQLVQGDLSACVNDLKDSIHETIMYRIGTEKTAAVIEAIDELENSLYENDTVLTNEQFQNLIKALRVGKEAVKNEHKTNSRRKD